MTNNFHNLNDAFLVDEYATLKLQAKAIEKRLEEIKSELIDRHYDDLKASGKISIEGSKYSMKINRSYPIRFDQTRAKEFLKKLLSKEKYNEFEMIGQVDTITTKEALPEILRAA